MSKVLDMAFGLNHVNAGVYSGGPVHAVALVDARTRALSER